MVTIPAALLVALLGALGALAAFVLRHFDKRLQKAETFREAIATYVDAMRYDVHMTTKTLPSSAQSAKEQLERIQRLYLDRLRRDVFSDRWKKRKNPEA